MSLGPAWERGASLRVQRHWSTPMTKSERLSRYTAIASCFLLALLVLALDPQNAACAARKPKAKAAAASTAVTITAPANAATVSGTVSISAQVGTGVSWIN